MGEPLSTLALDSACSVTEREGSGRESYNFLSALLICCGSSHVVGRVVFSLFLSFKACDCQVLSK